MVERTIDTAGTDLEFDQGPSDKLEGGKPEPARIAGFEVHSPGEFQSGSNGEPPRKKRGRQKGWRKSDSTPAPSPQNIAENLERLLLSVHTMGAAFLSCPELELDESEAQKIASAVRGVAKHYSVTMDAKKLAMVELSTVLAMVYGTRGVAIYRRVTAESKRKPAEVRTIRTENQEPKDPNKTSPAQAARPLNPSDIWGVDNGVVDSSNL